MSHREWFTTVITEVNYRIMSDDLFSAGISGVEGLSADFDNGRIGIDFPDGQPPNAGEIATSQAIVDGHDPTDYEAIVQSGAESQAAGIPGWAGWTEQETLDWIETNVTDLASAKQALQQMSRMVVALRNKTWPGLQE